MRREFLWRFLILLLLVYVSFAETLAQGADATFGTAIAAYRTENEIIVAVDSRSTNVESMCKILQLGDTFVTAGGLYRDPATNFNLWEILSMSAFGGGKLSDIVKRFETFVRVPLQNAVAAIKNQQPNLYQEKFINKTAIHVLFFGIEDNVVTMKYRKVYVFPKTDDLLSVNITAYDCPEILCPDGKGVVLLGKNEGDRQKIEEIFRKPFLSEGNKCNVVDLARKFVQMMIDKDSVSFGPPIDILSVTKDGAQWIQKKETCPEIKK